MLMAPTAVTEVPWGVALTGAVTGATLIIAIGAQNAFVLRQGILRSHVLPVVAICALSDAVLIAAGVAGMGALVQAAPALVTAVRWVGAAFLICYGLMAARRATHKERMELAPGRPAQSLAKVVATCLAFTWLNPHVYLDTLVFLGSIATTHGDDRWWFGGGAMLASLLWFSGLGYGARLLAPVFAKPVAWRVLDAVIAVVMIGLGVTLLLGS